MSNRNLSTSRRIATRRAQRGAALVVGMLLLLVLTLLAISGMNTASLELAMAGNMQFHENAFRAAEAGIEQAMAEGDFNPDPTLPPQRLPETDGETIAIPNTSEDAFFATITVALNGNHAGALPGSSMGKSVTYHFDVRSNGQSARNAVSTMDQGVAIIAPPSGVYTPGAGMPTTLTP
jgi:type IV pilus assembly protein PilX